MIIFTSTSIPLYVSKEHLIINIFFLQNFNQFLLNMDARTLKSNLQQEHTLFE